MDLRQFNDLDDIPEELYDLDILDGSPPCTTFSMAGDREKTWGKSKKFREGQKEQTLDDLFFIFLDTVEKLNPKIVVAENVVGIVQGNAKGYCNLIVKRFRELGYDLQIFHLNAATMDVPQARERIFFIANNQGYGKLNLDFQYDQIPFGKVRSKEGKEAGGEVLVSLLEKAQKGDSKISDVYKRYNNGKSKYFNTMILDDDVVAPTITSGGDNYRFCDRKKCTDEDYRNVQTFPQDYDFCGNNVKYVCGMSVPPNMMANIATEVYNQWLK
jgi:DNA (cytosine-5)-methyltransferase 1